MKKNLLCFSLLFFVVIFSCGAMSVGLSIANDACNESHGSLTSYVNGGVAPYSYLWSTGDTTADLLNIPAGTYTVTVTDFVGTTATASAVVNNGTVTFTSIAPPFYPCYNQCSGTVAYDEIGSSVYGYNGTSPYTYTSSYGTWLNNFDPYSNSSAPGRFTLTGICAGIPITVNITDALGCPGQETFTMNGTTLQNPSFFITPSCDSMPNGSVTIDNISYVFNLPGNPAMAIITAADSLAWTNCCTSCTIQQFDVNSIPYTAYLPPGNYYLTFMWTGTNYASCSPMFYWGCPQFFPFTIPDQGPICGGVQGDVFIDANTNCTKDSGEAGVASTLIEFAPGPFYAYTDASGHYSVTDIPWGNYNMFQHPPFLVNQFCPTNPYPILLSSSNQSDTVNFADTNGVFIAPVPLPLDIRARIAHGEAHVNSSLYYGINVRNLSNSPSGIVTVTLNYDPQLSFVSANPAPFATSAGQVIWQFAPIPSFQTTYGFINLSVPNNPSLIGDTLFASVNASAANPETNLSNNTASTWHIILGAVDPNAKTVEQPSASFIPATDGLFNFTIQFQNTGNDTAINVEVIDTLDYDLDVPTFVPGASSYPYTVDITGHGVLHFYFNNILLPDSNTDEPHSHGFVSFQIHCKANLPHGTAINNASNIVFDSNPAVNTNTTTNTVDLTLAIQASATTICAGQQVTLTMIPELQNTPWRWRTSSCSGALVGTGNSITVSPTVTTTYFVRDSAGTIPLGSCYMKTIVVNPSPTASINPGGPTTFCQGNSVTLTSSAASSYLWPDNSTNQSINVNASGNYFVTVTNAAGCSASSSAVSVTVNPLPIASITPGGPTTFCQGNSVTLTSNAASSYLWSDNSTNQSINVTASGNYFVTVTNLSGCSASSSAVSVTVNLLPNVSITPGGPTTFCQGNSVTLISTVANSYLWSNSSTSQSINVASSGNYFVTVTDANNCSASTSLNVTVNPNPPVPNITQVADSLISDAASVYQWYYNSVLIPGANSQSYHPTQNGNYSVVITDANNCTASSIDYPFVMTSIKNSEPEDGIKIYPNPAAEIFTVELNSKAETEILVTDLLGNTIQKSKIRNQKSEIDLTSQSKGVYLVKVIAGGKTIVKKVVLLP